MKKLRSIQNLDFQRLQRGQSLVEMAIGFVVLLVILEGLLDLGRAYFVFVALEDGAGEAALYLSLYPTCRYATDGAECADPNNAAYRARTSGGQGVAWTNANIIIERPEIFGVGDPVIVTIEYPFQLLLPLIPKITNVNPLTLTAQATQIIVGE